MLKIVHGADFHLDSPYKSLPQDKAAIMRTEQKNVVYEFANYVNNAAADVVLLAGDIFDVQTTFYDTVLMFRDILGSIKAHVFIAAGNHDYYSDSGAYSSVVWPNNVHIFKHPQTEGFDLNGLLVYGSGFDSQYMTQSSISGFSHTGSDIGIGVFHGDLGIKDSQYNPIMPLDIEKSNLTYLALGHVHSYSGLKREGNTYYCYSGSICGRGFDELGEKGIIYTQISNDKQVVSQFVPLSGRKYLVHNVSTEKTDMEDVVNFVLESLTQNFERDVVKLTVTLTSPGETFSADMLQKALNPHFFHLLLSIQHKYAIDIWEICKEQSFAGIYMSKLYYKYINAQSEYDKAVALQAARLAYCAIKNINPQTDWERFL